MGLFDFFSKQFIDVIDWTEEEAGLLSFRYPMADREIQNGAQLTVRDTQLALFVNEGELADLFEPGMHTLSTNSLPMLTNLQHWDKLFASPFKSDVYFFSTREQIDQRWGTTNPIVIRDKEFGPIRLRAHGVYSYRIKNPRVFFKKISGTADAYRTDQIAGQLRSTILTSIANVFGTAQVNFVDMAGNQAAFSEMVKSALREPFENYGLSLESFLVQSVSLPEELQTYLDKASSMKMMGDLNKYAQFQAADSIAIAAANEGGAAGAGAGLGAGVVMGQTMSAALSGNANTMGTPSATAPAEDPMTLISKLHDLMTKGIITQAEFDEKKAELLKKIV